MYLLLFRVNPFRSNWRDPCSFDTLGNYVFMVVQCWFFQVEFWRSRVEEQAKRLTVAKMNEAEDVLTKYKNKWNQKLEKTKVVLRWHFIRRGICSQILSGTGSRNRKNWGGNFFMIFIANHRRAHLCLWTCYYHYYFDDHNFPFRI
jgi:hypothetical protein